MKVLHGLVRALEILTSGLCLIGQVGVFVIAPLVTLDIIMRGVFSAPIPGVLEIVSALNVTIIFPLLIPTLAMGK